MKVMQVIAGAAEGGAETFFVSLVGALARAGLDQRAVIRRNPKRANDLREARLDPVELPFGGPFDFATRSGLKREIARYQPDIVLSWMSRASAMVPKGKHLNLARLGNYYKLKYFKNCDHLLCITSRIADYCVEQGRPRDRVHYMPNFASVEAAVPLDRRTLDTPQDAPLLLALSRLHPSKGLDILLQALAREPRAYLWLAGDGPLRSDLEQQARALDVAERVRFLGWRRDRPALLTTCDIVVFPSRYEPFGTVSLEAWGYGRPLVAAASDGPAGIVRDGVDGLLVAIDDDEALAAAVSRLIDDRDLSRQLIAAGTARYQSEFTEQACVQRYMDLFERLLAQEGRSRVAAASIR